MVGSDKCRAALCKYPVYHASYALVNRLDCLYRGVEYACVTYHVAVSVVEYDNVVLVLIDSLAYCVAYLICAHLGLEVECRHVGRLDEYSVLALELLLLAAVEEERYVSILLSLGDTELCLAELCKVLAHCHRELLGGICYGYVRHGSVVLSHADEVNGEEAVSSLEALELGVYEGASYLSCAVGTEVEEDNAVVCLYLCTACDNCREHELVRYFISVGVLYCLYGVGLLHALAVNKRCISLLDSVPCVVSVHCVEASRDSGYFAETYLAELCNGLLHVLCRRRRRNVTSVKESMDVHLVKAILLCHFNYAEKVLHMAVNTARREKSHKVKGTVLLFAVVHSVKNSLIIEESAVLDVL